MTEIITYPVPADPGRGDIPSASDMDALALCNGKFQAAKGLPELENEDQRFGDNVHSALAQFHLALKEGKTVRDPQGLTSDENKTFLECLSLEAEIREKYGFSGAKVVLVEERLAYQSRAGKVITTGKMDVAWLALGKLLIVDYKSGWVGATKATENRQLRTQALLGWQHFMVPEILVAIVSPNATPKITIAAYKAETLASSEVDITTIVKAALSPNAPRVPGEKQCRYCPAKISKDTCPEYHAWAVDPARQQLEAIKPLDALKKADVSKAIAKLDPVNMAALWKLKRPMGWLYDELDKRLRALSAEELSAAGMEIKPGRVTSPVTDIIEVFNRASALHGVTPDEFMGACDVGKAKLESIVKAKTGLAGAELDAAMAKLFLGCTTDQRQTGSLGFKEPLDNPKN